jgi:transposase InsO family protein
MRRIAGCRDYWSKYESPWHISPTANQFDAIEAVELALTDYQNLFVHPLVDQCPIDPDTGEMLPVVTIVTDNGRPFRSFRFEAFSTGHPESHHVRTRVKFPGQNGSRERGFESLKYERLYLHEIADGLDLAEHTEDYRLEYNTIRQHEALAWNKLLEVHLGSVDPTTPNFPEPKILPPS